MKVLGHPLARLLLVLIALLSSVGIASGEVAAFTYDDGGNFEEATTGALSSSFVEFQVRSVPNEVEPVAARGAGLRLAPDFVAPNTTPTVRGTSVRGEVTSRPGSFRKGTLQDAWDDAAVGPNGGRLCPTCDGEVLVPPGSGVPRDWDGSHNPSWSNREFPGDVQRPDVMDNFNEGVSLECPGCNRPAGSNDTRFGDARSGWPD